MERLSTYGTILTAVSCGASRERTRDATQSRRSAGVWPTVYWWQQDGCVADRRASGLQLIRDWGCASTPADRTGWSMGSHRAHPRSSTPIPPRDWRRFAAEAGPVLRIDGDALALGDVRRADGDTVGRELKAASLQGRDAPGQNELHRLLKKTSPPHGEDPGELPIRRRARDFRKMHRRQISSHWNADGPSATMPVGIPADGSTECAYIFGAICPAKGRAPRGWSDGAGAWCDTDAGSMAGAPHQKISAARSQRP